MTRVIGILGFVCLVTLTAGAPIDAQERTTSTPRAETLESVVITATKTETPVSQTGSSVTVIEERQIDQRQVSDMLQMLRDQPGFSVIQSGGRGTLTSIFTRGGNSDMNLVLIDGMKVNAGGGAFDFANISSVGIGRVEIVRGPQSALYGADAMTSVIQFLTPRGEGPFSAWAFAGGGNYGTHEERAGLSWGSSRGGVFFELGNIDTAGILPINNAYRNRTGALRLDLSPTSDLDFTLTARYIDSRLGIATEGAGDRFEILDPRQFSEDERFVGTLGLKYRQTSWLEHRLKLGVNVTSSLFADPADDIPTDFPPGSRTRSNERRLLWDYSGLVTLPSFWGIAPTIVLGASYESQNFTQRDPPFATSTDVNRDTVSGYGQVQLNWVNRVFLTAGGRYDSSSVYGQEFSPRVAVAVVAPVTETRLRGAWGRGIKEPSFFAQFGGFGIPGNPNLKSERSESWEIGLDQPLFGRLFEVGVTYFDNRFRDLVAFVSFFEGSKNIQAVKTNGVEFAATLRPFKGWTASGTYTFLETEVTDDGGIGGQNTFPLGQPLLRRPRHSGSVSVGYQGDRLNVGATLFVKGDSIDRDFSQPGSPRVTQPGYEKLDLSVAWTLFRNVLGLQEVTWKTRFQNVLNEKYEEIFGFSAPRLSALTGLEVRY